MHGAADVHVRTFAVAVNAFSAILLTSLFNVYVSIRRVYALLGMYGYQVVAIAELLNQFGDQRCFDWIRLSMGPSLDAYQANPNLDIQLGA